MLRLISETSLLRRLQGRPSPNEASPTGQIHPFSKMAKTVEPLALPGSANYYSTEHYMKWNIAQIVNLR